MLIVITRSLDWTRIPGKENKGDMVGAVKQIYHPLEPVWKTNEASK